MWKVEQDREEVQTVEDNCRKAEGKYGLHYLDKMMLSDLRGWQRHNYLTCRGVSMWNWAWRKGTLGSGESNQGNSQKLGGLFANGTVTYWGVAMMISLLLPQLLIQPGAEDQSELVLTSYFFCWRCDWLFSASYEVKTSGEDCYHLAVCVEFKALYKTTYQVGKQEYEEVKINVKYKAKGKVRNRIMFTNQFLSK